MRTGGNSPMLHGERALMAVILVQVGRKDAQAGPWPSPGRDRPEEWALLGENPSAISSPSPDGAKDGPEDPVEVLRCLNGRPFPAEETRRTFLR